MFTTICIQHIYKPLQQHISSHLHESKLRIPNYYCDRGDCKRKFYSVSQLEEHLRLHDNNLMRCYFCPWRGGTRILLHNHINHHFKFRPVNCSFCDKTFYASNHKRDHEERYHEKISDRYKCNICPFIHYTKDGIWRHKLKSHKN